jgi:hypothetical protein
MTPSGFARTTGIFVAMLAVWAPAAAQPCPALKAGSPDGNYIVPGARGDIRYSGDLALDAFIQPGTVRPSVVVIHGGGWSEDASLAGVISFYGVYDLPVMVTDTSPRSLLVRLFQRHTLDDRARTLLTSSHRCTRRTAACLRCC